MFSVLMYIIHSEFLKRTNYLSNRYKVKTKYINTSKSVTQRELLQKNVYPFAC